MRLQRLVAGALLAGALALVSGCDSRSLTTKVTATATASPSPEDSRTVSAPETPDFEEFDAAVPPVPPAGLDGPPSEASAAQVGVFYVSLLPYVLATGDRKDLEELATPDCDWCAAVSEFAEDEQSAGKHRVGGRIEVLDVQGFKNGDGKYLAVVRAREHPSKVVDARGNVVEEYETAQDAKMQVGLRADGRWAVDGVAVDTPGSR